MLTSRHLLGGPITYSEAKEDETNIVQRLTYVSLDACFTDYIEGKRADIAAIVAHHLRLDSASHVCVSDRSRWIRGSFNLCVPVHVQNTKRTGWRVLIRFPLPYKMANLRSADEKIRCEAATYAWLNQECPSIPTASLRGFGLSSGQAFTAQGNTPIVTRFIHNLKRRVLSLFGLPVPCKYVRQTLTTTLRIGYVLLDFIDSGDMLSRSYTGQDGNAGHRRNFFCDLARIQLTLFQKPLPNIGSLTIDDNSVVSVKNRPLTLDIYEFENEGIPTGISHIYSTVDTYVDDLLLLHDNRLRYQLNGASSPEDCIYQMSALSSMRIIRHEMFDRRLRHGPFILTLTDMHDSNIIVDQHGRIKALLDLEFACIRPIEMQHPPYWLTKEKVDRINPTQYYKRFEEYISILEEQEKGLAISTKENNYAKLLKSLWEKGTFWYCFALDSPTGLCHIFYNHILPRYQIPKRCELDEALNLVGPTFWTEKGWDFILSKINDKTKYDDRLRDSFGLP